MGKAQQVCSALAIDDLNYETVKPTVLGVMSWTQKLTDNNFVPI